MAVRYDKKFMNEINRIVRSYNAKISRLAKINYKFLPKRFGREDLQYIKASSITRRDVRKRLKDLQSFTARGGEKVVKVNNVYLPKYTVDTAKRYRRILSIQTARKLKKFKTTHPISAGKEDPFTFAQQGTSEYLTTKATRDKLLNDYDIGNMDFKEIKYYINKLKANTRTYDLELWQRNYIDLFQDNALSYGYDPDKLDVIVSRIIKLTPENFDKLLFVDDNFKDVLITYKKLLNIKTAKDFDSNAEKVIDNLDTIYENLDVILKKYE